MKSKFLKMKFKNFMLLVIVLTILISGCMTSLQKKFGSNEQRNDQWKNGTTEIVFKNDYYQKIDFCLNDSTITVQAGENKTVSIRSGSHKICIDTFQYNQFFFGKCQYEIKARENLKANYEINKPIYERLKKSKK